MKKLKAAAEKPSRYKSLIKAQFAITYMDSSILGPTGRMDPLIHSFDCNGSIVQTLPKHFVLQMAIQAIPVRGKGKGKPVTLLITPDIMGGGKVFHHPYTKAEIKKMRSETSVRDKEIEEASDYDE